MLRIEFGEQLDGLIIESTYFRNDVRLWNKSTHRVVAIASSDVTWRIEADSM